MASQKIIFSIFVVIFALCVMSVFSSPIPEEVAAVAVSEADTDAMREAKFFGASQASALAAASSSGGGFGYPGFGSSNSLAIANAASNSFGGYPYGK